MIVLSKGSDNVVAGYISNRELLNETGGLTAIIKQLGTEIVINDPSAFEVDASVGSIAVKITSGDISSLTPMDPNSLYTTAKTTMEIQGTNSELGKWTTGMMVIWVADGYVSQ